MADFSSYEKNVAGASERGDTSASKTCLTAWPFEEIQMHAKFMRSLALLLALGAAGGMTGRAQSAVDGAIGGTVEDKSGSVVPKAAVTIHSNATNAEQMVTADDSGYFRVIHLGPGTYTVTVAAPGFDTYRATQVTVTVGTLTDVDARLAVGSSTETVDVSSSGPVINTTSPDFTSTVDLKVLEDLPVNNYRWSSYALLTPGVVADASGFGLLSFRGQSTLLNNITFDGADDNQAFFSEERGRTRVGYSTAKASIQEFQVNTSNYSVEYGRSAGGVVNAVTRSGSNSLHGEAYFFDRDAGWGARNPFTTRAVQVSSTPIAFQSQVFKPKDWRKQMGVGIGGPIIKDKLFFFFAFDDFMRNFPGVAAPASPSIFYAAVPAAPNGTNGVCAGTSAGGSGSGSTAIAASAAGAVCQLAANLNGTPVTNTTTRQTGTTPLALTAVTRAQYTAAYNIYTNGIASLNTMFGLVPRTGDQNIFFPKIDWQVNSRNHVSLELNRLRWTSPAGIQTGTSALAYGRASFGNDYVKDTFGIAKLDSSLTPTLSNEIRYQYGRDFEYEFNQTPTAYENSTLLNPTGYTNPYQIPPLVTIANSFTSGFGTATFLNRPAYPDERRYQIADTINLVRGHHNLKFGIDYLHTNDLSQNLTSVFGSFAYGGSNYLGLSQYFTDLNRANACAGGTQCYTSYSQGFGPLGFEFQSKDYAGFIQDEWKVKPQLSLTLGLRYEYEQLPSPKIPNTASTFVKGSTSVFPDNRSNIGPRVGFAYDVKGNGKTVLRGGYGEFFARVINSTVYNALAQTGNSAGQLQVTASNSTTKLGTSASGANVFAPAFPNIITPTGFTPQGSTAVIYFDRNFKLPQIHQADLTIEQDLGYNTTFAATWLYAAGRRLPDFVDTNLPRNYTATVNYTVVDPAGTGSLRPGSVVSVPYYAGARPNAAYGSTTDIFSGVNSNYEGLVAEVKHRTTRNLSFDINYTWSHALDYGENNTTFSSTNLLFDPQNLRADYGNSNQNVPNRIVAYAIYNTPSHFHGLLGQALNNFEISPSFSGQSGLPYSAGIINGTGSASPVNSLGARVTAASNSGGINGSGGAARLPYTDRNIYKFRRDILLDFRVSKRFEIRDRVNLELLAESFNIFNHLNVTNVSSSSAYSIGPGTAASATAAAAPNTLTYNSPFGVFNPQTFAGNANSNFIYTPRQVQLGARVQF